MSDFLKGRSRSRRCRTRHAMRNASLGRFIVYSCPRSTDNCSTRSHKKSATGPSVSSTETNPMRQIMKPDKMGSPAALGGRRITPASDLSNDNASANVTAVTMFTQSICTEKAIPAMTRYLLPPMLNT